jgi:catechol 2,3-dioxygenase-like lactoylglutathione lyase family enzyme
MEFKFDHVHLNTADLGAATDFYINNFGAEKIAELDVMGTPIAILDANGTRLLISAKDPSGASSGTSLDHIGFGMADLDAAAVELKEKGVEFTLEPMPIGGGMKIAFVKGPDDVMIELVQS